VEVQKREKEEKERREKEREEEKIRLLQQREKEKEREREREKWQQREKDQEEENMVNRPPVLQSSKSAPGAPVQQSQQPRQGANVVIPAIQPLQPTKKVVQIQQQDKLMKQAFMDTAAGGVAAAEAALTKPKEKRISTMTEVQIMEKLKSVVSAQDPKLLYSKIKKVGQGWVNHFESTGSI